MLSQLGFADASSSPPSCLARRSPRSTALAAYNPFSSLLLVVTPPPKLSSSSSLSSSLAPHFLLLLCVPFHRDTPHQRSVRVEPVALDTGTDTTPQNTRQRHVDTDRNTHCITHCICTIIQKSTQSVVEDKDYQCRQMHTKGYLSAPANAHRHTQARVPRIDTGI